MLYQITEIVFDFDDGIGQFPIENQTELTEEIIASIWEADDGDDLVEEITAATGWCVRSIDYRHVLS